MTPTETLAHLRALTDPTPEQLQKASDLALLARGWKYVDPNSKQEPCRWVSPAPEHKIFLYGSQPHPCASIDDAVRWMVPEGAEWGRDQDGMMWVKTGGFLTAQYFYAVDPETEDRDIEPEPPALALTIAGLAATLEGEK